MALATKKNTASLNQRSWWQLGLDFCSCSWNDETGEISGRSSKRALGAMQEGDGQTSPGVEA